ncbi:hypothetical protein P167DRAFT_577289 [Morchella conica CCBAS932]|uniref:Uncharacterized protein n=1 Tax=Morchella conica CCBAS932 TaxID=1392247 RepID=A0A3N4KJ39_9PEZI|nr:hypothetical protein P167DRAFT_577289 [Morchella conica CCBAS932]
MPQPYLSYDDHFLLNHERREAILRLGQTLIQTKNDLTFFPRTAYNLKIRKAMVFCIATLKEFKIKNLHPALLDQHKDICPLAHLYNLGVQILALREVNIRLEKDINKWDHSLKTLQDSLPEHSEDVGLILAEVHEFLAFATVANQIHPFDTLTSSSIKCAAIAAKDSGSLIEDSHAISILQAAFTIQTGLQIQRTSNSGINHVITNAVSLPQIAIVICSDWYNCYKSYASCTGIHQNTISTMIPFENLVTWFTNARRRIIGGDQSISPGLKSIVNGALSSKPLKIDHHVQHKSDNGDGDPEWEIPLSRLIAEFLDELGDTPKFVSPNHIIINRFDIEPPINPMFFANNSADKLTQGCQHLLKSIYSLFNEISSACLDIFQRAHWLNKRRYDYALKAKRDIDDNCLRAITILLATRGLNQDHFERKRHSRPELLETIFEIFPDPNLMEEEYLSNVTGMNINQIHTWCRKSPDPQSYLYTLPNNALSSL